MKKTLLLFFSLIFIYSNLINCHAKEGYIETLLDLNVGIEEYDLELAYIDDLYFTNDNTQQIFDNFKIANRLLKNEIIKKYREGEFDYYQIKGIITNQKMFVYHINKLSQYLQIKEQNPEYTDTDSFILKHYSSARIYFNRVKYLASI